MRALTTPQLMGILATRIGGQAQDCLPSPRPRQELFSRLSGVCRWPNDPEGFRAMSLRRVARSTDVERVRDVAKVRELSISSSSSAIDRSPVPDIEARGASKLSPTTDQQTVQAICASARLLYERSVRPAYAMNTLSTGYQRPPQPP